MAQSTPVVAFGDAVVDPLDSSAVAPLLLVVPMDSAGISMVAMMGVEVDLPPVCRLCRGTGRWIFGVCDVCGGGGRS